MRIVSLLLFVSSLVATGMAAAQAQTQTQNRTVYRCSADGKTTYADRPCERGPSVALPPPAAGVDASLGAVRGDDSRTLLEVEKLRIARERREREADRQDLQAYRAAHARHLQCERLRQRARRAEDAAARARGRKAEPAQVRLRRARDTLAAECPA